jgi:hypothetical protein
VVCVSLGNLSHRLSSALIETTFNTRFPFLVHLSAVYVDYVAIDNWCQETFGTEGENWEISIELAGWMFKTLDDALLMEFTWEA